MTKELRDTVAQIQQDEEIKAKPDDEIMPRRLITALVNEAAGSETMTEQSRVGSVVRNEHRRAFPECDEELCDGTADTTCAGPCQGSFCAAHVGPCGRCARGPFCSICFHEVNHT